MQLDHTFDPPKYEAEVNHHLRNFGDPEAQHGEVLFDHQRDSAPSKKRVSRRTWIAFAAMLLVAILGTILLAVLLSRPGKKAVQAPYAQAQLSGVVETVTQSGSSTATHSSTDSTGRLLTVTSTVTPTSSSSSATPATSVQTVTELSTVSVTALSSSGTSKSSSSSVASTVSTPLPNTSSSKVATVTTVSSLSTPSTTQSTPSISLSSSSGSSVLAAGPTSARDPVPTASTLVQAANTKAPTEAASSTSSTASSTTPTPPSSSQTALTAGGRIFFCSVPGSSCNEKRMALGIEEGAEGYINGAGSISRHPDMREMAHENCTMRANGEAGEPRNSTKADQTGEHSGDHTNAEQYGSEHGSSRPSSTVGLVTRAARRLSVDHWITITKSWSWPDLLH